MSRKTVFVLVAVPLLFLISLFGAPVQALLQAAPNQNLAPAANAAAKIAPELRSKLESLPEGQMVTAIVTMDGQADLSQIPGASRAARLEGVIRALQARASASQRQIINSLAFQRSQGLVDQVIPMWVFNGLSVTATAAVIEDLAARADVARITPDDIDIVTAAAEPNLSLINAPALWDLNLTGQGIVVANMDSGVDYFHPELNSRWRGGSNSWYDPYGQHAAPYDASGHGTWTMGIMVGGSAGGTAIGVAPQAQWIAVKIFNDAGGSSAAAIHQGFQWLLDPDGNPATDDAPHVINNSWSLLTPDCNLEFEPDLQAVRAAGILPVFAAGNSGPGAATSRSPANNPSAFAVGAAGNNDLIYSLSSRGPSSCDASIFPELVAPGVGINTTDLFGFYTAASGTSMAAPHVSAGLALLLGAFPDATAADQEAALLNSGVDLGPAGPDNDYGYGRIDLLAAYQWLAAGGSGGSPTPTPVPPTATSVPPTATPPADVNLALNRPATFSSFEDSAHDGTRAVDGDLATWWQTARARGKSKLPAEWITIDLGAGTTVGQVVLRWADSFATSYTIQVSDDNSSWTELYQTNAGTGGTETISFSPVTAAYLKLETTAWSSGSLRNWLRELELYPGSGSAVPTATPMPTASPGPTTTPPAPTPTSPPPAGGMHVADLDGSAAPGSRNRWDASVSIWMHSGDELPLAGATVSGSWSGGASGSGSCITNSAGICSLTRTNIKGNAGSVRFTVDSVSHAALSYQPAANHDPDGDSDGRTVIVLQP